MERIDNVVHIRMSSSHYGCLYPAVHELKVQHSADITWNICTYVRTFCTYSRKIKMFGLISFPHEVQTNDWSGSLR